MADEATTKPLVIRGIEHKTKAKIFNIKHNNGFKNLNITMKHILSDYEKYQVLIKKEVGEHDNKSKVHD